MKLASVAIVAIGLLSSGAVAQDAPTADTIKTMPCEDLAVALTSTLSGASGALTESTRLAVDSQPPSMVQETLKNQAMGAALGALPGQAANKVGAVVTAIDQQNQDRKDAERQADARRAETLQSGAVMDLEIVAVMSEEHARRCEG